MKRFDLMLAAALAAMAACPAGGSGDGRFASAVVSYQNLGSGVYGDPDSVLGKPTTWIAEPGGPGTPAGTYACSLVYGAWNTAPDGTPLVVTLGSPYETGEIVVEFDPPILDDPDNWYGMDLIVFGNSRFNGNGLVKADTDMEQYYLNNGSVFEEPLTVSASQDNVHWFTFAAKADSYWPTNAFAWDRTVHAWGGEMDWTKPVNPALSSADFAGKSAADAIDLYCGSAGGTAFDLAEIGLAQIRYVKVSGRGGEVDGFAWVTRPRAIGEAKLLADGMPVSLSDQIVTAGTSEVGDCFYIESPDRASGVRVVGGTADRDTYVMLSGVMASAGGEREIRLTWMQGGDPGRVRALGVPIRAIARESGLDTTGLLVRTWGRVRSVDSARCRFVVDDGSGWALQCAVPEADMLPGRDAYVSVTGISSRDGSNGSIPVVRVRRGDDIKTYPE